MKCPNPNYVWPKNKVIAVPCGKCMVCLSNKRHDWSVRLEQEQKVSKSSHFVTLTYSEKYYPTEYGVIKRHLQLYFKRLRKECPKLRYYAVGEYGSNTGRAHYHAIIFNAEEKPIIECWTLTRKIFSKDSKELLKKVKEPIGIVHIGQVNQASIRYVTKYVIQKNQDVGKLNPPFALMSRAYGLGAHYLTDAMVKWHRANDRVYMMDYNTKHRLPRFYKDKIWPNSTWSDWAYKREQLSKKIQKEADQRESYNLKVIASQGYKNPEKMQKVMSDAVAARIKSKVAFSQKTF